jgi:hypothetical protein
MITKKARAKAEERHSINTIEEALNNLEGINKLPKNLANNKKYISKIIRANHRTINVNLKVLGLRFMEKDYLKTYNKMIKVVFFEVYKNDN